jgi:hypothetical protein
MVSRMARALGASVITDTDLDTFPFWVVRVWTLAVSLPDRPAGIAESNSATAHPQEGFARRILTS